MSVMIRFGPALLRELGEIAARENRNVSELLEDALRQFVRSHRETVHLASTRGNLRRLRSAHAEIESIKNEPSLKKARTRRATRRFTPYQAAIKVGLVGCTTGRRDLAENRKKYLRTVARAKRPA